MQDPPYFIENKAWYSWSQKTHRYYLTDLGKSLPKVVKSFEEFYATDYDEDGNVVD